MYVFGSFTKWIFISLVIATEAFSDPLLYSAGSGQTSVSTNLLCSLRRDVCTERRALYFCCFPCLEVLLLPCLVLHILPRLQGLKCHSHYESFFCSPAWLAFGLPLLHSPHCLMWWLSIYSMCFIISYKLSSSSVGQIISLPWDVNCQVICLHQAFNNWINWDRNLGQ